MGMLPQEDRFLGRVILIEMEGDEGGNAGARAKVIPLSEVLFWDMRQMEAPVIQAVQKAPVVGPDGKPVS